MSTTTTSSVTRTATNTTTSTFAHVDWARFSDYVVVFVLASSIYAAILYNFGIHDPLAQRIVGLVFVTGLAVYAYVFRSGWRTTAMAVAFVVIVLIAYGYLREFSYDGLNYHGAVALMLDRGEPWSTGMRQLGGIFWVEHYPKAFEFFAYAAQMLTSHFNSGKSFTLLLSVPALFALMQLFETTIESRKTAFFAAAACIYNPVAFGQLTTMYVDSVHFYCWTIFSVNLLFAIRNRPYSAVQLGAALVLLIGSKMTGLVFGGLSTIVFFAVAFIAGEKRGFLVRHKGLIGQLAIWSIVAVAFVGYSPYVQNILAGKHIFYPLLGAEKIDIIVGHASPHFLHLNPLHRLFLSYFSIPFNCSSCGMAEPTFVPSMGQLRDAFIALHTADTRFAGFGPFFGSMLIVGVIPFFWKRKGAHVIAIYLLATLVIVLIHPQSWWARYVPMFYTVPFLLTAAFSTSRKQLYVIIVLAFANSALSMASVAGYVLLKQTHYKQAVASVRELCKDQPVALPFSQMNWEFDLRDDHIRMATNSTPTQSDCTVNFDQLMVMKK
ncbi:hypothetical protein LMG28614_00201 [Paraburkholderia ultramafica]|uniref:Glycosyltransferase RgtA/B/C/D-like domain-containing protein n=1 Tax=Paraburkholderia ultramafica TaxID=1544867 RepID=A0A6S7ASG3_9BURK|nr:hypothetical protein [Paraburkholderia ultramafica]CAB3776371.1 hypothetical protein LMG28614_00201 [Paraburkholderia ultramafica]